MRYARSRFWMLPFLQHGKIPKCVSISGFLFVLNVLWQTAGHLQGYRRGELLLTDREKRGCIFLQCKFDDIGCLRGEGRTEYCGDGATAGQAKLLYTARG